MLLSELTLDYEILADDPIEMGIHFGQSILNHVSSGMESARSYSAGIVEEISAGATKVATIVSHPKPVETFPLGAPISIASRALKPRSAPIQNANGQGLARIDTIEYRKRRTVNAGLRPLKARGSVGYQPRSYASRNTFVM